MKASHSEVLNAPIAAVWDSLLVKIRHPEAFVPGAQNVKLLGETADHVKRSMQMPGKDGSLLTIVENITWDEATHTVIYTMIEHPFLSGRVLNVAAPESEDRTKLTYDMDWEPKEGMAADLSHMPATVVKAVQASKAVIEEKFRASRASA